MAGANPQKGSSNKPSSSRHRKSQPESAINNPQKPSPSKPPSNSKPSPSSNHKPPNPNPKPNLIPSPHPRPENFAPPPLQPPPPAYGFHMLDRRTIVLADGSARSYFALPPDYQDFPPSLPRAPIRPPGPDSWLGFDRNLPPGRTIPGADDHYRQQNQDYLNSLGLEGSRKRKFGDERDEANDEFSRQRQQLLQYGSSISISNGSHMAGPSSRDELRAVKHMRPLHNDVDQAKLKSSFLSYIRVINENANQKKKYMADGVPQAYDESEMADLVGKKPSMADTQRSQEAVM
ncbi:hypothetical protein E3N88_28328 [Mikania micrantha]|uniref:Uncharacterized protein n=1 Tax=Mikania micrantha TaxID=192012 RepID=A0A5N6N0C8_9ASTR|nr:hypothetical protein E3N88_28328 [Mikania micrantha]